MNRLLEYITPDWEITWDTKQIAEELPGFTFLGPGWYYRDSSWLLITNTDIADVYTLQAFFDRDPRLGFASLVDAPVYLDKVGAPQPKKKPFQFGGILVLVIGMCILMPLSVFLIHKFGVGGLGMLLVFAFLWGQLARWFFRNTRESKKT